MLCFCTLWEEWVGWYEGLFYYKGGGGCGGRGGGGCGGGGRSKGGGGGRGGESGGRDSGRSRGVGGGVHYCKYTAVMIIGKWIPFFCIIGLPIEKDIYTVVIYIVPMYKKENMYKLTHIKVCIK